MADQTPPPPAAVLPNESTSTPPPPAGVDYKTLLLQLLDLDPSADDAAVQAAFDTEQAEPDDDAATTAATSTLQTQLDGANARIAELETAAAQSQQDEINELIEEAGELPDDAKAALRNALAADPTGGKALVAAMKKTPAAPAAAAASTETSLAAPKTTTEKPPVPTHNPKEASAAAPTDAEVASKAQARVKELQKEFPKRQYGELHAQATKEIRNQLSSDKKA